MGTHEDPVADAQIGEYGRLLAPAGPVAAVRREAQVDLVVRHLNAGTSLVLIGPEGSGRTTLIEAAIRRLNKRVIETSTTHMLANTRYLGDLETRMRDFLALCADERLIPFYTDLWALMQVGRSSRVDRGIGTVLASHIQRKTLTIVGECTEEQFRKASIDEPLFGALFHQLRLTEPPEQDCLEMLRAVAERRIAEVGRRLALVLEADESLLRRVVDESRMAFPGLAAPGRLVRLLDAVIAEELEAATRNGSMPEEGRVVARPQTVLKIIEKHSGMSMRLLDDSQPLDMDEVRRFLEAQVLGQGEAIRDVVNQIAMIKSGLNPPGRPMSVMLFLGPTGVGKTELARRLAEYLFGSPERLIRLDMSEYADADACARLAGTAHGDLAARQGELTSRVLQQPFCVLLLDELEKAHTSVFDLLLQVFDAARLTDADGRTADFTRTIIIMTSNLGGSVPVEPRAFGLNRSAPAAAASPLEAIEGYFRPEFIGRIGQIVRFVPLDSQVLRVLAQREVGKLLIRDGVRRRNVQIEIDPAVYDLVVAGGITQTYGARFLARHIESRVHVPLARTLAGMPPQPNGTIIRISAARQRIAISVVKPAADRPPVEGVVVRVVPPGGDRPVSLTRRRVGELVARLEGQLEHLRELCQAADLDREKTELLQKTLRPDFWDNPDAARQVQGSIYRIEGQLRLVETLAGEVREARRMFHDSSSAGMGHLLEKVGRLALALEKRMVLASFALMCRGAVERCDAFLDVRLLGTQTLGEDPVGRLATMYLRWARSQGLQVRILDEQVDGKSTQRALLLVEGTGMCGVLLGEDGIHELHRGKFAGEAPASAFVEVRVLPRLDEPRRPPVARITAAKSASRGRLIKQARTEVKTDCPSLGIRRVLRSDLDAATARSLAAELLLAEALRREKVPASDPEGREEQPVRRYKLKPHPGVRDFRTEVSLGGIEGVWKGEIDELIQASLRLRLGGPPDPAYDVGPSGVPSKETTTE